MRWGPTGQGRSRPEVLRVTYPNGEVEKFADASDAALADRNSMTLELRKGRYGGGTDVVATLVLANVRKWEWVPVEQPEGSDRGQG